MIFKTDSASFVGNCIFFCSFLVVMEMQELLLSPRKDDVGAVVSAVCYNI